MKKILLIIMAILMAYSCSKQETEPQVLEYWLSRPANVKVKSITKTSVTIKWDQVWQATHYRYNITTDDSSKSKNLPRNVETSETVISVDNLEPGTTYHFRVRSEDNQHKHPADGGNYPLYSNWAELDFTTKQ